jgi:hypothetical protein
MWDFVDNQIVEAHIRGDAHGTETGTLGSNVSFAVLS